MLAGFGSLFVLLIGGRIAIPEAVAAAAAGAALRGRLTDAAAGIRQLQEAAQFVDDYAAVTGNAPRSGAEVTPPHTAAAAVHPLTVSLHDVQLRYPGTSVPALRGITLTLRTGQVVAVVGPNGSGKSTLAAVLAGLLPPTAGAVRWDGTDLGRLPPSQWHTDVATLLQEPGRYQESLRDNVAFGAVSREVDDTCIRAALTAAGADPLLRQFPAGLAAGHVVVLDHGRVIEQGSPDELIARGGTFSDMCRAAEQIWELQAG